MYLTESIISTEVKKVHNLKKGTLYVFDNFIVSEFNEGIILDFDCIVEVYHYLNLYSKNKHNFGYISNRIHQYTVKVTDFMKANVLAQKMYPSAVVAYDEASKNTFKFEKQLNNCHAILCDSLENAVVYLTGVLTKVC
ncbi:hypothetical protein [Dokdonia sp.]|uniref:hypothetical protein n=1 Tax=Dokdonia sp. TaxID=2024995 RepID=UPI0032635DA5